MTARRHGTATRPPPAGGTAPANGGGPLLPRLRVLLVAAVVVTAVAALALTGTRRHDAERIDADAARFARSVLAGDDAVGVAAYVRRFPGRLVPAGSRELAARARLDGATTVAVPSASGRTLLAVACAADDRSFEYRVTTAPSDRTLAHGFGACGALRALPILLPATARPVEVLVVTRGIDPFSVAVYRAH